MSTKKSTKEKTRRPPCRKVKRPKDASSETGGFGTDPKDSERLLELRQVIDDDIGWRDEAQMEAGDYASRLREVARLLEENGLKGPRSVPTPVSEKALKAARYWGAEAEANPGSSFQDYATDIALKAGYKKWTDVPKSARRMLLNTFKEGREEERRLVSGR